MRNLKLFIIQSWLLILAAFVCGLLLAVTYSALKPRIDQNEIGEKYNKMKKLLPQAETFEVVIPGAEIAGNKTDIYQAKDASGSVLGYSFVGTGSGFADQIKLVIALDSDAGELLGFDVLFSNETPGFGSKIAEDWFVAQFINAPAGQLSLIKTGNTEQKDDNIVAITGATVSSTAVVNIFNAHIEKVKELLKEKGLI